MPDDKDDTTQDDDKAKDPDDKGTQQTDGGTDDGKTAAGTDDGKGVKDDQLSTGKLDVEEILDEYGLDSAEDLKGFIAHLADMEGKIGDNDLDALIENTKTLQKYQANWQQQEEEKQREKETPEETIARLEKEKTQALDKNKTQADKQKKSRAAKIAIDEFNDTITSVIEGNKEVPKEYRGIINEFMGVKNPINEVDITDKAAVRRLTKAGIKKIQVFEQGVIKRYLDGKVKIPKVTSTETTPGSTGSTDAVNPKNLKEAKAIMMKSARAYSKR